MSEIEKYYYPSGKLHREITKNENGDRHGVTRTWYETGEPRATAHYHNGVIIGEMRKLFKDGTLEILRNHNGVDSVRQGGSSFGRRHGLERAWYENGFLRSDCTFVNGKRHGVQRRWHENGVLSEWIEHEHGRHHGAYKLFHENGLPDEISTMKQGNQDGDYTVYHVNGEKTVHGRYVNGKRHGEFVRYFTDGAVHKRTFFNMGTDITDEIHAILGDGDISNEDKMFIKIKWGIECK